MLCIQRDRRSDKRPKRFFFRLPTLSIVQYVNVLSKHIAPNFCLLSTI